MTKRLMTRMAGYLAATAIWWCVPAMAQSPDSTYAERLGFPSGAKVLILHVDDAGMSYESNQGAISALTRGVANSVSVMMPCPWVPGFVDFLKKNPRIDAGLHLTLTSEWSAYRWGPLMGRPSVPTLVDGEGALWPSVAQVVAHSKPEEVYSEIMAQLQRARSMGFEPTHLDSHMGTLFATPAFLQQYVRAGMEQHIPVMLPGGHATLIGAYMKTGAAQRQQIQGLGKVLWNAGLPVLDDLHNETYDWKVPEAWSEKPGKLRKWRTDLYIKALKNLQPGLTMMIMHCTDPSPVFPHISDSGPERKGDLLVMEDPLFRQALIREGIILTTWREVMQRRQSLMKK